MGNGSWVATGNTGREILGGCDGDRSVRVTRWPRDCRGDNEGKFGRRGVSGFRIGNGEQEFCESDFVLAALLAWFAK